MRKIQIYLVAIISLMIFIFPCKKDPIIGTVADIVSSSNSSSSSSRGGFSLKKLFLMIFFLTIFFYGQHKKAAVIKFIDNNVSPEATSTVSKFFLYYLKEIKRFDLLYYSNSEQELFHRSFEKGEYSYPELAVRVGESLNVEYVFTGIVSRITNKYLLTISMVDVASGEEKKLFLKMNTPDRARLLDGLKEMTDIFADLFFSPKANDKIINSILKEIKLSKSQITIDNYLKTKISLHSSLLTAGISFNIIGLFYTIRNKWTDNYLNPITGSIFLSTGLFLDVFSIINLNKVNKMIKYSRFPSLEDIKKPKNLYQNPLITFFKSLASPAWAQYSIINNYTGKYIGTLVEIYRFLALLDIILGEKETADEWVDYEAEGTGFYGGIIDNLWGWESITKLNVKPQFIYIFGNLIIYILANSIYAVIAQARVNNKIYKLSRNTTNEFSPRFSISLNSISIEFNRLF